jgi:hypothetical protein
MLQAVGGELLLKVLLDTTAPLIPTRHLMPVLYNLKMITALFAETLDNFHHSTRIIPKAEILYLQVLQCTDSEIIYLLCSKWIHLD